MVHFLEPKAMYCYASSYGGSETESGLKNICLHPANLLFYFLNNRFDLECFTYAEHHLSNLSFSFVAVYHPFKGRGGYFFIKCVARGRRSRGVFHHDHRRLWVEISHQSNLTPALATRSGLEKTTNTNSKPARAMMPSRVLGENIRE